jgi:hypothetical protein
MGHISATTAARELPYLPLAASWRLDTHSHDPVATRTGTMRREYQDSRVGRQRLIDVRDTHFSPKNADCEYFAVEARPIM